MVGPSAADGLKALFGKLAKQPSEEHYGEGHGGVMVVCM